MSSRSTNYAKFNSLGVANSAAPCAEIKTREDKQRFLQENRVVCIDMYADWCGPCKVVGPMFAKLAEKANLPGKCILVKENIDNNISGEEADVTSIPTFLFYVEGRLVDKVVGGDMKKVEALLRQYVRP